MGKLDELRRIGSSNASESMGVGVPLMPGVSAHGPAAVPSHLQGIIKAKNVAAIPLDKIGPDPDQPREEFDPESLERLAESLKTRGQLQPIRVRWHEGRGLYMIVCGERRWRAARLAELSVLTCVIMDGPVESAELLALQLIENCVREDLKPIEQARAFRILMDANGWSTRQLARELAVVQPQIVRMLSLLELPAEIQEKVEQGELAPATAYEIGKLPDQEGQLDLAHRVVLEGLTRQEAVEAVKRSAGRKSGKGRASKARKLTSRTIRTATGSKVTVENRRGLDAGSILAALLDAAAVLKAEMGERGAAEAA